MTAPRCDTCGQLIGPDEPAFRRAIVDEDSPPGVIKVIGQWQWHRDCPPAGPASLYDQDNE